MLREVSRIVAGGPFPGKIETVHAAAGRSTALGMLGSIEDEIRELIAVGSARGVR